MIDFRTPLLALALGLGLMTTATAPVFAQEFSAVTGTKVLPGWRTARGTHMAAIYIRLGDGWKTYWRAPGDSGIPPRFDWSGSRNIGSVTFHWPRPRLYESDGVRTLGYKDTLILPVEITPRRPGAPIRLRADMELGVCETICMPVTVRLHADLPANATQNDNSAKNQLIARALARRPDSAREAGVGVVRCAIEPIADGLRVTAEIPLRRLGPTEVVVFELPDQDIWISGTDSTRNGTVLVARADLVPPSSAPFSLQRSDLRITVIGGDRAVDIQGCRG